MKKIQDNLGFYPFQKLYFFSTLNLSSIIEEFTTNIHLYSKKAE